MSIYDPLGAFLRAQTDTLIPMTFQEIEQLLQISLPPSKSDRGWWDSDPAGNPMSRQWLEIGYTADTVDVTAEKLVFRRATGPDAETAFSHAGGEEGRMLRYSDLDDRLLFLSDRIILEDGYDYTQPLWPTEDEARKDG